MIFIKLHELLYSVLLDNNIISWLVGLMLLWRPFYFIQINFSKRYSSFTAIRYIRLISIGLAIILSISFYIGATQFEIGYKLLIYFIELLLITELIGGILITFFRQLTIIFNAFIFAISEIIGFIVQVFILFSEIYLLSKAYSFFFIKHTDLVFESDITIIYYIITFCIYIYALIISLAVWLLTQGLLIDILDTYVDFDLFRKRGVKVLTVSFATILIVGSFYGFFKSANTAMEKNDGYGILNTTSDLDIIPIMDDYLEIAQKIKVDYKELEKDTVAFRQWMILYQEQLSNVRLIMDTLQYDMSAGISYYLLKKDSEGLYEFIDNLFSENDLSPNTTYEYHNALNAMLYSEMELFYKHPEIKNIIKMQYISLNETTFQEDWQNKTKIDLMIGDIYYAYRYGYTELGNTLFKNYFDQLQKEYASDPIMSLYSFIKLAEMLNYADKHHKAEKVLIRSHQMYASNENILDENHSLVNRMLLSQNFNQITEIVLASISFQRLDSDMLLDLIKKVIDRDNPRKSTFLDNDVTKKMVYFDYMSNIKPHYEVAMNTIARYINKYPHKVSDIENILVSLIERNKSRWYNYSLDINSIEVPPKLKNGECGLNYMNAKYYVLGQYYDQDTTINFSFNKSIYYIDDEETIEMEISELWSDTELYMAIFKDVNNNFIHLSNNLIPNSVKQRLPGKSLLISADGFLQEIPFQYLLNDISMKSITHIPGFSSYQGRSYRKKNNLLAVSVAKPNFLNSEDDILFSYTRDYNPYGDNIGTLVFADKESEYVSSIASEYLDGETKYLNNPSESWVKQNISQYDILHFSTHSTNYAIKYEDCGIFLNQDSDNDGFFSGKEIEDLPLSGQMVFLSGCESATGEYEIGEGTASIARSFLKAGASEIIATLWKINDQSIFELSSNFYKHYFNGIPTDQAVYLAQKEFQQDHPSMQFPLIYISK